MKVENPSKDDKLFEDPDFKPSPQNIYLPQDIVSAEEAKQIENLKWLRPSQISLKNTLVGFRELATEGIVEKELDNLGGSELADFRRICYGEVLEDRWFLNALSMLSQEERLLSTMTLEHDKEITAYKKLGLHVFRFIKRDEHFYVIIDDRIPTTELPNG